MACLMEVERVLKQRVEVPGLGDRIKQARLASSKSLTQICKDADISRQYWYQLENEDIKGALQEVTLRKVEQALGIDLGVKFDD